MSEVKETAGLVQSPVIVALDYDSSKAAMLLVEQLNPEDCRLKVGKQLFTVAGPEFVRQLVKLGYDVFLDLKFHDIPNTVASACKAAADLGIWMLNVHASGGREMMEAARKAVNESGPLLIGVSVLTSLTNKELKEIGISRNLELQVESLTSMAMESGLDGMVCSAQEATHLKQRFGDRCLLVTPGIRTSESSAGDQRRIMTPEAAVKAGSDYLVIGRSLTAAADPLSTLRTINESLGVTL